jgi:hypothetical protein
VSVRSARYNLLSLRNPKGLTFVPEERDAWAFLDAAGIKSSREQRAVIELVRGLKHAQLWSKMKAIYPFVGGTATTHRFNLKDPRDADAAFRMTFSGGWTHSSNGADPNGTNAYADTFMQPSSALQLDSMHMSILHRENRGASDAYMVSMGTQKSDGTGRSWIIPREGGPPTNTTNVAINTKFISGNSDFTTFTDTTSVGYYLASRTTSTKIVAYKNGDSKAQNTTFTSDSLSNNKIFIGAYAAAAPVQAFYFSNLQISFATIGDGLTDSNATNLYNIVQRYQTSLGRQV